jgi:hypothetical protein
LPGEVQEKKERIHYDNRTQKNADNPDFKYTELTDEFIRILYRVYNKRGSGFREKVYGNAMMIELIFGTKPEVKRKVFEELVFGVNLRPK